MSKKQRHLRSGKVNSSPSISPRVPFLFIKRKGISNE